jgi:transporter family-2 protein
MYYFLAVLSGCVISVMIALNGKLTAFYGIFSASVIIHIVGTLFSFILIKARRMKLNFSRSIPLWFFLGGVIGVGSTVFNNLAFGRISMTSIVALGLLGQTVTSIIIDSFGLMGMTKRPLGWAKVPGLVIAVGGIAFMLSDAPDPSQVLAIAVSFGAGITVVMARTVNSRLSDRTGALQGSFYNHIVGLPVTIVIMLLFGRSEPMFTNFAMSGDWWIYFGGCFGVATVLLFNITVPKMRMLDLTFLSFAGEVFSGIAIDLLLKLGFSNLTFWGGLLVSGGLLLNLCIELIQKRKAAK